MCKKYKRALHINSQNKIDMHPQTKIANRNNCIALSPSIIEVKITASCEKSRVQNSSVRIYTRSQKITLTTNDSDENESDNGKDLTSTGGIDYV